MHALDRLLRPKSIAVIGGGRWCENVVRECRKFGFDGELWAVHPTRAEIAGCATLPSLDRLPIVPDAAYIGVNRIATVDIVRELAAMNAGGAVCFASGFQEAAAELSDGAGLQGALVEAAGDMPVLGPNCYGFINALDGAALWPDQHGLEAVGRGVAIVSQSSNIALNLTMQARGLPVSYLVTVGNQAQTDMSQICEALLDDDRVTALGLHIEGIGDLGHFERLARRANSMGKPIIALKVGKSEQARRAAISHTAAIAGSSAGSSALFRRLGIAEVSSLPVLLEALKLVHVTGALPNAELASMSCSGGEASLMADIAKSCSTRFPDLTETQKDLLREVLGPKVALANPLDYHTYIWGDVDAMSRAFGAMMSGPASLGIVVLDFPRQDRCSAGEWLKVIDAIEVATKQSGKPIAVLSSLSETLPETIARDLINRNIVPLCGMAEALEAIGAVASCNRTLTGKDILAPESIGETITLTENSAKDVLSAYGLQAPKRRLAHSCQQAVEAAQSIGLPVVLKATGFAHKTEAGAVALNLGSLDDVKEAAIGMPVSSLLVEEMVTDAFVELLVGVVLDPAHGYVLTLGAGGILTELLDDSVSLILPTCPAEIEAALNSLKIGKVLKGYRGRQACDLPAIISAVMAVQEFVSSVPSEEVEINPLLCGKDFAIAADALIKCGAEYER
ncbi:acetate--CoA ligase family protein [uncultured Roseibium sp.]|uniref:acetate--CoA ligase family protein n=1 Tax=uncultured Roseibium sp. TaxID=1936171 RepID=UPI0026253CEA|nr:acetate--CoA ligase family protein [uncultured Roseibium sp.]